MNKIKICFCFVDTAAPTDDVVLGWIADVVAANKDRVSSIDSPQRASEVLKFLLTELMPKLRAEAPTCRFYNVEAVNEMSTRLPIGLDPRLFTANGFEFEPRVSVMKSAW